MTLEQSNPLIYKGEREGLAQIFPCISNRSKERRQWLCEFVSSPYSSDSVNLSLLHIPAKVLKPPWATSLHSVNKDMAWPQTMVNQGDSPVHCPVRLRSGQGILLGILSHDWLRSSKPKFTVTSHSGVWMRVEGRCLLCLLSLLPTT